MASCFAGDVASGDVELGAFDSRSFITESAHSRSQSRKNQTVTREEFDELRLALARMTTRFTTIGVEISDANDEETEAAEVAAKESGERKEEEGEEEDEESDASEQATLAEHILEQIDETYYGRLQTALLYAGSKIARGEPVHHHFIIATACKMAASLFMVLLQLVALASIMDEQVLLAGSTDDKFSTKHDDAPHNFAYIYVYELFDCAVPILALVLFSAVMVAFSVLKEVRHLVPWCLPPAPCPLLIGSPRSSAGDSARRHASGCAAGRGGARGQFCGSSTRNIIIIIILRRASLRSRNANQATSATTATANRASSPAASSSSSCSSFSSSAAAAFDHVRLHRSDERGRQRHLPYEPGPHDRPARARDLLLGARAHRPPAALRAARAGECRSILPYPYRSMIDHVLSRDVHHPDIRSAVAGVCHGSHQEAQRRDRRRVTTSRRRPNRITARRGAAPRRAAAAAALLDSRLSRVPRARVYFSRRRSSSSRRAS